MESSEAESADLSGAVSVTVVRTGGVAGTRREWRAEPPADEAPRWIELIEGCPWDAVIEVSMTGADRFVWRIDARCGPDERDAELPDSEMRGPWRDLVEEVRQSAGVPARPSDGLVSPASGPVSPAKQSDDERRGRARRPR